MTLPDLPPPPIPRDVPALTRFLLELSVEIMAARNRYEAVEEILAAAALDARRIGLTDDNVRHLLTVRMLFTDLYKTIERHLDQGEDHGSELQ